MSTSMPPHALSLLLALGSLVCVVNVARRAPTLSLALCVGTVTGTCTELTTARRRCRCRWHSDPATGDVEIGNWGWH